MWEQQHQDGCTETTKVSSDNTPFVWIKRCFEYKGNFAFASFLFITYFALVIPLEGAYFGKYGKKGTLSIFAFLIFRKPRSRQDINDLNARDCGDRLNDHQDRLYDHQDRLYDHRATLFVELKAHAFELYFYKKYAWVGTINFRWYRKAFRFWALSIYHLARTRLKNGNKSAQSEMNIWHILR